MKNKFLILLLVGVLFIFSSITFATELPSNQKSPNEIYLDDYDEYEDLMSDFDQNEINKEYYLYQVATEVMNIEENKQIALYEAEILEISDPEIRYERDGTEYVKKVYQSGIVRIIDKRIQLPNDQMTYLSSLSYDKYDNIRLSPYKVGDKTYVTFLELEEGNVIAVTPESEMHIERLSTFFGIMIIFFIVALICFGKHSVAPFVILVLFTDILIWLVAPLVLKGFNMWLLLVFTLVLTATAIAVIKLGVNYKAFVAVFTTCVISAAIISVHYVIDSMLDLSGITLETSLLSNVVTPLLIGEDTMPMFNFYSLNVVCTILISFGFILLTSCKTLLKHEEHKSKAKYDELLNSEIGEYISEMSLIAVIVMLAKAFPKYVVVIASAYNVQNAIQSEIFMNEMIRILIAVVGMMITVPMTLLMNRIIEDK